MGKFNTSLCEMAEHKFGIFYVIVRIILAVLTLLAMICVAINLWKWIEAYDHGHKLDGIIWSTVALLVSFLGFYGAWKEHFLATLVFGISALILLLAGIAVTDMREYTRIGQICSIIISCIYCWMLYASGNVDYSPIKFRK